MLARISAPIFPASFLSVPWNQRPSFQERADANGESTKKEPMLITLNPRDSTKPRIISTTMRVARSALHTSIEASLCY